jgi:hypothetical protein
VLATRHWPDQARLIPHPPAFVHLLRILFALLGEHDWAARLPGLLAALTTLALLPPLARACFGGSKRADLVAAWAGIWFAAAPLTVQNMALVDIDNTVMVPATAALLWLWMWGRDQPLPRRIVTMSIALAACAWLKLPPPAVLAAAIAAHALVFGRPRDSAVIAAATAIATILFVAGFTLQARLTGFGWDAMNISFAKVGNVRTPSFIAHLPQAFGTHVLWISTGVLAVAGLGLVAATRPRTVARAGAALLATWAIFEILFHSVFIGSAWGYPKYAAPALPAIALLAALPAAGMERRSRGWVAAACAAVFAGHVAVLRDPLASAYRALYRPQLPFVQRSLTWVFAIGRQLVATFAVPLGGWLGGVRSRARVEIVPLLVGASLGVLLATNVAQIGARYSTRYLYGLSYPDLSRLVGRLHDTLPPHAFVAAPKEVLFYGGLSGTWIYDVLPVGGPADSLLSLAQRQRVDAWAWTLREETRARGVLDDPRVQTLLAHDYAREDFGDYVLWRRRSGEP